MAKPKGGMFQLILDGTVCLAVVICPVACSIVKEDKPFTIIYFLRS